MDPARKARNVLNRLRYDMPDRYGHLTAIIGRRRCRTIMEIGVWDAEHARLMLQAAIEQSEPSQVAYYGFDLFEEATEAVLRLEVSKSQHTLEAARRKLQPFSDRGAGVHLLKGNTLEVLPATLASLPPMDFVFVDGGHSYETVKSDWTCVSSLMTDRSIVLFDDYVNTLALANENYGVNQIVDEIDRQQYRVELLRPVDAYPKSWGTLEIRLAQVTRR